MEPGVGIGACSVHSAHRPGIAVPPGTVHPLGGTAGRGKSRLNRGGGLSCRKLCVLRCSTLLRFACVFCWQSCVRTPTSQPGHQPPSTLCLLPQPQSFFHSGEASCVHLQEPTRTDGGSRPWPPSPTCPLPLLPPLPLRLSAVACETTRSWPRRLGPCTRWRDPQQAPGWGSQQRTRAWKTSRPPSVTLAGAGPLHSGTTAHRPEGSGSWGASSSKTFPPPRPVTPLLRWRERCLFTDANTVETREQQVEEPFHPEDSFVPQHSINK